MELHYECCVVCESNAPLFKTRMKFIFLFHFSFYSYMEVLTMKVQELHIVFCHGFELCKKKKKMYVLFCSLIDDINSFLIWDDVWIALLQISLNWFNLCNGLWFYECQFQWGVIFHEAWGWFILHFYSSGKVVFFCMFNLASCNAFLFFLLILFLFLWIDGFVKTFVVCVFFSFKCQQRVALHMNLLLTWEYCIGRLS